MKYILSYILCLACTSATACDVCGGGAGAQGLGILPQLYNNFAGLQYQHRNFSSIHPSLNGETPGAASKDYYNTLQLWGRCKLAERVSLFAFVPYQVNKQVVGGSATIQQGLGDMSLLGSVAILKKATETRKQVWLAGAGVKLPTGRSSANALQGSGLPETMPGTGTVDVLANTNYTHGFGAMGLNLDASYIFTTPNAASYKYGNRLGVAGRVFYTAQKEKWVIVPQAGIKYEYSLHDYDNYKRKWLNTQTGGSIVSATVGMQLYYSKVGLQLNYYYPIAQQYAAGFVKARQQADAGVLLLF